MLSIIWEFKVRGSHREEFEREYGSSGTWAQLFGRSPDFLGTELRRDIAKPGRYLTIDRWAHSHSFEAFCKTFASEYAALDQKYQALSFEERLIGQFETVD